MTSYTIELFIIFYDVNGRTNISVYTNTNVDTNTLSYYRSEKNVIIVVVLSFL